MYLRRPMAPTIRELSATVARHFYIRQSDLEGQSRMAKFAKPRQILMFLAHEMAGISYPKIGAYLGRDHTTALHGHKATLARISENPEIVSDLISIACEATTIARDRIERSRQSALALRLATAANDDKPSEPPKVNIRPETRPWLVPQPRTVLVPFRDNRIGRRSQTNAV